MSGFRRAQAYLHRYGLLNFIRKGIFVLCRIPLSILHFYRKVYFYLMTRCWVHRISGKISVSGLTHQAFIGKNATFYPGASFEFSENARLQIGDNFVLSYGSLIACHLCVTIGHHVMIGEYTSVRDTTHDHEQDGSPYQQQLDISENIEIRNNVWVGRGCIILPGTVIEEGVIVGANSVVKGRLKAYWLYGGSPVRPIKPLREERVAIDEFPYVLSPKG
jgi:acetyltransferase-like isoleucine patch superfamily enzyme